MTQLRVNGWIRWVCATVFLLGLVLLVTGGRSPASTGNFSPEAYRERICGDEAPGDLAHAVTSELCGMEIRRLRFTGPEGDELELTVFVADESAERRAGYQYVGAEVIRRTAIFFLFPQNVNGPFHMCHVAGRLDIAWIRDDGSILDVGRMLPAHEQEPPGCAERYAPQRFGPYRFALEVNGGFFQEHEIGAEGAVFSRLVLEPWMTSQEP